MKAGTRVRVSGLGHVWGGPKRIAEHRTFYGIKLDQHDRVERIAWFASDRIAEVNAEITDESFAPQSEDWREVCAEAIRYGRDAEALALLIANSPSVAPYIRALEDFARCFYLTASDEIWFKKGDAYEASTLWKRIRALANSEMEPDNGL